MELKLGSSGVEVVALKRALNAEGGVLDPSNDYFGDKTESAVKFFQSKNGLEEDGVAGPLTQAKLFGKTASTSEDPKWIIRAKSQIGVKEVRGGENPQIIAYDSATTLKAKEDEVAWCSAFVCWCLEQSGIKSNQNAWAQSQATFGKPLSKPQYGCIVVFRWSVESGHVGFYMGTNSDGSIKVLGGNQSDSVRYSNFGTGSVIAYRWPE